MSGFYDVMGMACSPCSIVFSVIIIGIFAFLYFTRPPEDR